MHTSRDEWIRALAADAMLGRFSFEPVEVAGVEAIVTRLVPPAQSVMLWRAAHACRAEGFYPVLTNDYQIHPDIEPVVPPAPMPLDEVRAARERVVRSSAEATEAFLAIAHASPQAAPYDERDCFLEDPESATISLVIVKGSMLEAVGPFSPDGQGQTPRSAELLAMLRHWNERYGAEALYADGYRLELAVRRPPGDPDELRALARDCFLLSQGTREGFGIEDPARLLRRLMSDRWVVWWYGTM